MIRAIIIDDEVDAREGLLLILNRFCPDISIEAVCSNPKEGIETINNIKPDLLFLDIQMPYMSGFAMLEELHDFDFEVIFVTAFDQFAIRAIKFSALDYLLKPVDLDELQQAVKRASERIQLKSSKNKYTSLLKNVNYGTQQIDKLAIPSQEGILLEPVSQIILCEADRNYTNLRMTGNRKLVVSKPLKDFEEILGDKGFFRVHHAYLINMRHVNKYIKGEGGYVILEENLHVDVSRRKREAFIQHLNKLK